MLNLLIGPVAELAGTWLNGKVEKTKAETGAKVARAKAEATIMEKKATGELDWDLEMAKGSKSSWKDEWLTIIFTVPMVVVFYGAIADDPAIISRITLAVQTITELPEWYVHIMYGIVAASFGLRTFNAIKK